MSTRATGPGLWSADAMSETNDTGPVTVQNKDGARRVIARSAIDAYKLRGFSLASASDEASASDKAPASTKKEV